MYDIKGFSTMNVHLCLVTSRFGTMKIGEDLLVLLEGLSSQVLWYSLKRLIAKPLTAMGLGPAKVNVSKGVCNL